MRTPPNAFLAALVTLALSAGPLTQAASAATPYPMSGGNYSEAFGDIANWGANFASGVGAAYWSSVPIVASGAIPDGVKTTVSTAAFTSGTSGGVQKGTGNIQLLSTNGTDLTNACAIDLLLDFTNMNAGTLSYDFATVNNSTGNRNGSLRVYTSTDGTTFTELTDASVLNFTNNVAYSKSVTAVTLPASFNNCATARIRFYDYNGTGPTGSSGARPKASIDNVAVTATSMTSGGPTGPVVSNFSTIPSPVFDTTAVTIQASVVDTARALNAVSLSWGLSNSSLTNIVSMAQATGNFWQTANTIPAQTGGSTVYYQVTAVDDSMTVQSAVLSYSVGSTSGGSTSAPTIKSVYEASDSTLEVFFSTTVDPATSQVPANYTVGALTAVNAVRDGTDPTQVWVTVRGLTTGDYTLTATGVGDLSGHYTSGATGTFHYVDVTIPSGYYAAAAGLKGMALLNALHNIIKGHTVVGYSATATSFQHTDKRPDGNVWDVYSDVPGGTPPYEFAFGPMGSGSTEGVAYNREHSFPQSWFGGSVSPMYSDLWIIYPTDSKVNGMRGNYPYGKVASASWTSLNGTKLGTSASAGYSGTVYEPIDGYKGDLARSQFYVATRYITEDSSWPGGGSTSKSQLLPWAAAQYLAWHEADAVSWKERVRNGAIYEQQHNRNPFVDHPEYAIMIYDSTNVTAVAPAEEPRHTMLAAAQPNPFRSATQLAYDLPKRAGVSLRIYDVGGRLVRTLVPGTLQEAGRHTMTWDGLDDAGATTPAGLYFGRLEAAGASDVRRVVRIR